MPADSSLVIAGLVPAIPLRGRAIVPLKRDGRACPWDKPGHDIERRARRRFPMRSESEVDAAAEDVGSERHVVDGQRGAAGGAAIEVAEVDVEILRLQGPVVDKRVFDAA